MQQESNILFYFVMKSLPCFLLGFLPLAIITPIKYPALNLIKNTDITVRLDVFRVVLKMGPYL